MKIISTMAILMFAMLMVGSTDAFAQVPEAEEAPVDSVEPRVSVDGDKPIDSVEPRVSVDGDKPIDSVEPRVSVDGDEPADSVDDSEAPDNDD
jgi:hypothetical protein